VFLADMTARRATCSECNARTLMATGEYDLRDPVEDVCFAFRPKSPAAGRTMGWFADQFHSARFSLGTPGVYDAMARLALRA